MPDKDCIVTIITHFLFKNWYENSIYNLQTTDYLTSRNHYTAQLTMNIFVAAKFLFKAPRTKLNVLQYSDFKVSHNMNLP